MSQADSVSRVSPQSLKAMLLDRGELALIDVREELTFSEKHLLFARSVPLSRLELRMPQLVPRLATRIVVCDDGDGLAARAAAVLRRHGCTDVAILDGGVAAWAAVGFEVFSGVNVPSKAFGEFVEHASATPNISADELNALMVRGADLVVLDSRPFDEFHRMSIPTGINVPGAELMLRIRDAAPSPQTLVVVNCAGRTRSIIGAQSLIDAGVPNKVVALRNGTMGWTLAGLTCDRGKDSHTPAVSEPGLAWAKTAADRLAQRFDIARIDLDTLARFRREADARSLYLLDVRDPPEYAAGHVPGAVSAPGGQLVQATDQYIGTLNARVVLVDDKEVRALMTASWLKQMGWRDVCVLAASGKESGWPLPPVLGGEPQPQQPIGATELAAAVSAGNATVVDLSLSRNYLAGHIRGAWFAIRARLDHALANIAAEHMLVLTSEDGRLAALAEPETQALTTLPVRALAGGNAAWKAAGLAVTKDNPRLANEPIDVWLKPYERAVDIEKAMADYLSWEVDLLPRIARDGCADFRRPGAHPSR
jgi:rhodanese-related sulfurtransferase